MQKVSDPAIPVFVPLVHGLSQVRSQMCTSFSSHFFSGVTYGGAIHTGPLPEGRMTMSTRTPADA